MLYGDMNNEEIHLFTEERFLPNILLEVGFFMSNSEVKKTDLTFL